MHVYSYRSGAAHMRRVRTGSAMLGSGASGLGVRNYLRSAVVCDSVTISKVLPNR